ncbi:MULTISPECIES: hypothetical protein [Nocardia]|uniref:hypothetical protein n=1 Tax=Nocardia TaxID=1817 RepID=UPI000D691DDA|nr:MULTISPECIES: hypothetical protein [Nocardia]
MTFTVYATTYNDDLAAIYTVPEEAVATIDTYSAGTKTYLAGEIAITADAYADYITVTAGGDRFALMEDGITFVRVIGDTTTLTGAKLILKQSWDIVWPNGEGGPPVPLALVEPSPPMSPFDWFFDEIDRALLEYNAS